MSKSYNSEKITLVKNVYNLTATEINLLQKNITLAMLYH